MECLTDNNSSDRMDRSRDPRGLRMATDSSVADSLVDTDSKADIPLDVLEEIRGHLIRIQPPTKDLRGLSSSSNVLMVVTVVNVHMVETTVNS